MEHLEQRPDILGVEQGALHQRTDDGLRRCCSLGLLIRSSNAPRRQRRVLKVLLPAPGHDLCPPGRKARPIRGLRVWRRVERQRSTLQLKRQPPLSKARAVPARCGRRRRAEDNLSRVVAERAVAGGKELNVSRRQAKHDLVQRETAQISCRHALRSRERQVVCASALARATPGARAPVTAALLAAAWSAISAGGAARLAAAASRLLAVGEQCCLVDRGERREVRHSGCADGDDGKAERFAGAHVLCHLIASMTKVLFLQLRVRRLARRFVDGD